MEGGESRGGLGDSGVRWRHGVHRLRGGIGRKFTAEGEFVYLETVGERNEESGYITIA